MRGSEPSPSRAGLLAGPRSLRVALRTLRAHRELWSWALAPLALNLITFALAAVVFLAYLEPLTAFAQAWLAVDDPRAWYQWIWVAPIRALAWLVRWLLILLFALATYFAFTLVGGVLASPFLDVLSRRVEVIARGEAPEASGSALAQALRSLGEEAKRIGFFAGVQLGVLALGLVPGLQLVSAVAVITIAALFLPLDYTGYALDRRGVRFRERRRWLWHHRGPMLGFGGAALLTFAIPGLNFLCLPWLVTAGTLLALEVGPPNSRA
jgi:CysZ protein